MKRYSNADFAFNLPDQWPYRDESDATAQVAVFDCPDAPARLTISLRRYAPETPQTLVAEAFTEFVQIRRSAELEVSEDPEDILLTDEEIVDGGGYLFSKYAGVHGPADRRFAALIAAENGKMLCFYVESVGTSSEYLTDLANSIFDSVVVH